MPPSALDQLSKCIVQWGEQVPVDSEILPPASEMQARIQIGFHRFMEIGQIF